MTGLERSPSATAGGTGNVTPPRRLAGVAVGAGVRPRLGPLSNGPPMAGRPTGRHLGRVGPGLQDVRGPGPAGIPQHQLQGMRLPLGERAQVLRQAALLLQCHMAGRRILQGAPSGGRRALVPLWGRLCAGLRVRPLFAAKGGHGAAPARLGPASAGSVAAPLVHAGPHPAEGAACFLMTYFPRPPGGGLALLPYARGRGGSTSRGSPGQKSSARGARVRAEGEWVPGVRNMARPRGAAACSWAGEPGAAAQGTRDTGRRDSHPARRRGPRWQVLAPAAR